MQKEYITSEVWAKMLNFFENHSRVYAYCSKKLKLFVEAVYWMARGGTPWRMLPEKYGNRSNFMVKMKTQQSLDITQKNNKFLSVLSFNIFINPIKTYCNFRILLQKTKKHSPSLP